MSEPYDHDDERWPLRDWATRLHPQDRHQAVEDDEIEQDDELLEPAAAAVAEDEPFPISDPEPALQPPQETVAYAPPVSPATIEEHAGGEFRVPGGYQVLEGAPSGGRRSVGVVVGRFNSEVTNGLLESALAELEEAGVTRGAILVVPVPGAFELPLTALALAKTRRYSCIVALGCVIRGETPHFDYVASEAASGLQLAGIESGVPVAFGVLTCDTAEQAMARLGKGAEAARTALEMADVFGRIRASAPVARSSG
jgi:6,7-dimethyl-8-ribityllumazine synthase